MKKLLFLWFLLFSIATLLLPSCKSNDHQPISRLVVKQKNTPSVAIAPVIDSTNFDISWSLSEELTSLLYQKMQQNQKFFLPSSDNLDNDLSFSHNPFGSDLSWVKKSFSSQQFVVFLELVQHEMKTAKKNHHSFPKSLTLDMALRIRIVDLREKKPTLVLQELIQSSYFIPQTLSDVDYNQTTWGSKSYTSTPLYQAHLELLEEASKRISAYIHP